MVLEYLWNHQEKYADLLELDRGVSSQVNTIKKFLPDLVIQQTRFMLRKHLMWMRLSMNRLPYLVAIYTVGGTSTTGTTW